MKSFISYNASSYGAGSVATLTLVGIIQLFHWTYW